MERRDKARSARIRPSDGRRGSQMESALSIDDALCEAFCIFLGGASRGGSNR